MRSTLRSTTASSISPARTAATSASPHGPCGPGHDQVLRRPSRALQAADAGPVADDDAVEAPLAVQRGLQQRVLAGGGAVDRVVGAHDQPGPRLGDGLLEGQQVQLAQRPVVDPDVGGEAVGLEVVGDVVLGGGAHAVVLDAGDVGGGEVGGEHRVLAEALEVPAAERGAVQVDRGAEDDVDALAARLDRRRGAVAAGESGSQEEARAVADGRLSEGSRSSHTSPRTPEGPSDTRMRRRPIDSIGQVFQKSRPVSSCTFSSSERAARASESRVGRGGRVGSSWARSRRGRWDAATRNVAREPAGGRGRRPGLASLQAAHAQ